jgi:glycosyltransferase involved in cell wall biosynthesis
MKEELNCVILLSHDGINSASAGVATYTQTYINAFHKILNEININNKNKRFSFFLITTKLKNGCSFKNKQVFIHNKKIVNDLDGDIFEVDINSNGTSNYGLNDDLACEGWNIGSKNAAAVIKEKILSEKEYDNVYIFANDTVFLGISECFDLGSFRCKLKIILVPHSTEICHKTNIKGREEYEKKSFSSKNTFKVGYISDYFKKHLMEDYEIDEKDLIPIKCAIAKENSRFRRRTDGEIENELKKYNIPLNKKLVAFIGRLDVVKGIEEVINFFYLMNKKIEGLHLIIQGFSYYENDPYIDVLKNLINDFDIKNHSFFTELNLTLPPYIWQYKNTLVNLYLSRNEPFGLTSVEARYMAKNNGLIAINSRIGGLEEQIIDGYNGFLCKYGDKNDYERVINFIKNADAAELQKIRDNSYRDILNNYNTEDNLRDALKEIGIL